MGGGGGRQHTLALRYMHSFHNSSVISLRNSLPYIHLVYINFGQSLLPTDVDISKCNGS